MIPWFEWTVIQLGPIPIQVWGFWVALGMVLAVWVVSKRASWAGQDPERIVEMALWAIVGGLIGSRVFHVVFYDPWFYLAHPADIIKIWQGGLSSFGGLFGAVFGGWLFVKKKNISVSRGAMWRIADVLSFAAVYGWIIGRVGCFSIHDHLGMRCDCFLAINTPDGPRLEMALLEILMMIPLGVWFFISRNKKKPDGWFLHILFLYYGTLRFVLDFFRATDIAHADIRYLGLTPAQYFSMVLVFLGVRYMFKKKSGRFA